jgi:hypothetical protein
MDAPACSSLLERSVSETWCCCLTVRRASSFICHSRARRRNLVEQYRACLLNKLHKFHATNLVSLFTLHLLKRLSASNIFSTNRKAVPTSPVAQVMTLLTCIRAMPGSNLGRNCPPDKYLRSGHDRFLPVYCLLL